MKNIGNEKADTKRINFDVPLPFLKKIDKELKDIGIGLAPFTKMLWAEWLKERTTKK